MEQNISMEKKMTGVWKLIAGAVILLLPLFVSVETSAQQAPPSAPAKEEKKKPAVKKKEAPKKKVEDRNVVRPKEEEDIKYKDRVSEFVRDEYMVGIRGLVTGVSAGWFMPIGNASSILNPTWTIKAFVQSNSIGNGRMGYGFDASYSDCKDKDIKGGITYYMAIPYFAINIPLLVVDVQVKLGAGFAILHTLVIDKASTSADLTGMMGLTVFKTFRGKYIIGVEVDGYYIMEQSSTQAFTSYFVMGYRF
jgi:hypothetical protein